ncbi:MAG: SagB/ThcOx family dehydrogenase [Armatimonadetes bacterium]|nr:SagB/ThcOx family dehydrogenase [Armatimonadota bacterium]
MPRSEEAIGPKFNELTKYHPARPIRGLRVHPAPPLTVYPESLPRVALPEPLRQGGPGLWETIQRRRSRRDFTGEPITLEQLSQLLWAVTGVTGGAETYILRATASAGALYPNDTYLVINAVQGLNPGLAFYEVPEHRLCILAEGDFSGEIARAALGQEYCATAAVVLVWAAEVARSAWKYSDRAYRYIYLDAGHLGAHAQLAAEALGLGSVNIGAFYDDEVGALFGIDGQRQVVVYMTAVGKLP